MQWKGKTRGGTGGYRAFIFLLTHGGLRAAYFLLAFVAPYYLLVAQARKPMVFFFRTIMGYGPVKTFRYLILNNYRFGQVLIDKVALMAGMKTSFTFEFDGEDHLRQMAAGGGGFLIGAHMGNWEAAGQLLTRLEKPVHVVMLQAEHEKIRALLDKVETEKAIRVIPVSDDMSHLVLIRAAMERGELIAMHGDRFMDGSRSEVMPFMGHEAAFPAGPFSLAVRYQKPVTFVSALRYPGRHYILHATPPNVYTATRKEEPVAIRRALSDYIARLEMNLRQKPEQWFNYYYFWQKPQHP